MLVGKCMGKMFLVIKFVAIHGEKRRLPTGKIRFENDFEPGLKKEKYCLGGFSGIF